MYHVAVVSFFHCVASPFHSFVTTMSQCSSLLSVFKLSYTCLAMHFQQTSNMHSTLQGGSGELPGVPQRQGGFPRDCARAAWAIIASRSRELGTAACKKRSACPSD